MTAKEPTEVFAVKLRSSGAVGIGNATARMENVDDDGEKAHAVCYSTM